MQHLLASEEIERLAFALLDHGERLQSHELVGVFAPLKLRNHVVLTIQLRDQAITGSAHDGLLDPHDPIGDEQGDAGGNRREDTRSKPR